MMCEGKAVKGDLMAVMVQCETKHPACVKRETVSTIRKYVSTRRSPRRPNVYAVFVRHVCPALASRCCVGRTIK